MLAAVFKTQGPNAADVSATMPRCWSAPLPLAASTRRKPFGERFLTAFSTAFDRHARTLAQTGTDRIVALRTAHSACGQSCASHAAQSPGLWCFYDRLAAALLPLDRHARTLAQTGTDRIVALRTAHSACDQSCAAMLHRAQGCGVSTTASLQPVESGLGHPCDAAPTA
eukprot:CAMPEP_0172931496 /NCGR_PEP_ID=MMETSP1075-20121228/219526_1 /TAXON_ID=2916 /ORGANISM="Ceratium fusus, Strain PA161109" /LENGTH=168 /DNA_ID=CAMNT_0013792819 /DNA_START=780 /DNA_END=1288 /DNA_ORIENTATION=+